MDLKDLLLYTSEELSPEQRNFVREHQDELSEEDKQAYSSFLNASAEEEVETVVEDPYHTEEKVAETPTEVTPQANTEEPKVFKTQEEIDAYVKEVIAKSTPPAPATPEPTTPATPTPVKDDELKALRPEIATKYFPEGYTPANPVEYANRTMAALKEQAVLEENEQTARSNAFNKQYLDLATERKLPDPTTEEGVKVKSQITELGIKYKANNYAEAYDLWSKIPSSFGGGLDYKPEEKKSDMAEQKKLAGMVGGGGNDKPTGASNMPYNTLRDTSMDDLIDGF
jgi:hypothetical protein